MIFLNIDFESNILLGISRMESLGRQFRGSNTSVTDSLLLYSLILIAICVVLGYFTHWLINRSKTIATLRLFHSLCRANNLDWKESMLLWQTASKLPLRATPGIFLRPDLLEKATTDSEIETTRLRLGTIFTKIFIHDHENKQSTSKHGSTRKLTEAAPPRAQTETMREAMVAAKNDSEDANSEKMERSGSTEADNDLLLTKHLKNSEEEDVTLRELQMPGDSDPELSVHESQQNRISAVSKIDNNGRVTNSLSSDRSR